MLTCHHPSRYLLVAALALHCAVAVAARDLGPTQRVREAVGAVVAILEEGGPDRETRWRRIGRIIDRNFDFQSMSQSVLATNWKRAASEEKRRFVEFFSQYIEATFRAQIEAYAGERVEYTGERITGGRALVDTLVVSRAKRIPVSYKLRLHDGRWLAYDVVIEGVSLIRNYRNTFAAIVKSEGMEGLLADVQRRIDRYRAGPGVPRRD